MYVSKIKTEYIKPRKARICQGDILRDVSFLIGASAETADIDKVELSYGIVMNQDCDLNSDYRSYQKNKKQKGEASLPSILICPAYTAEQFFLGQHLEGWTMRTRTSKEKDKIKKNEEYKRYHYLRGSTVLGIPELVIDFKHFYTVPRDVIYNQRKKIYIGTTNELYREDLSQRFSNFLTRIGLPDAIV